FIRIILPLKNSGYGDIFIEGTPWDDFPVEEMKYRFSINTSTRKSFLNLELEMFTEDQKLLPIPSPFLLFVSEQGWISSFRTKTDAITFARTLIEDFDRETGLHKKFLHSASKKALMSEWISLVMEEGEIPFFDPEFKKIFILNTSIFKKIFLAFLDSFNEAGLKTSFYSKEDRKVIFQIPKNNLLDGIAAFYKFLIPLQIPIFYDQHEIKNWKSTIRFERDREKLDWFQMDLVVSDEDLEIIKNAEITDNYILSSNGLILLSDEQKNLLRF